MISFNFSNSTRILYGEHKLDPFLLKELKRQNKRSAFLATDPGLVQTGIIERIEQLLHDQGISVHIFSDVSPNPKASSVRKGALEYQEANCDFILAIGGGSPMDFAKAVGVVVSHGGDVLDYVVDQKPIKHSLPFLVCVPTTAGTGSEVTSVAVVTDEQQERKLVLASPLIGPDVAIIDPILTATLPRHIVATTGMDAFVHAIESYTSINANPFTDSLALQSMKMLKEHLPASYAHAFNSDSRAQVQIASTMAGVAFNAAGLGLVHACSHPMSALFQVPHGLANAIILPKATEYNVISNVKKYADIARILNPNLVNSDDETAAYTIVDLIEKFNNQLDLPKDFSYLKEVTPAHLEKLVNDAMQDQLTIPLNPRKVEKEDVEQIYKKLLPQLKSHAVAHSSR